MLEISGDYLICWFFLAVMKLYLIFEFDGVCLVLLMLIDLIHIILLWDVRLITRIYFIVWEFDEL